MKWTRREFLALFGLGGIGFLTGQKASQPHENRKPVLPKKPRTMTTIRWSNPFPYSTGPYTRREAISYSSSGSIITTTLNPYSDTASGVGDIVSRHRLTGDGTFTFKINPPTGTAGTDYTFGVGLDPSANPDKTDSTIKYRVRYFNNIQGPSGDNTGTAVNYSLPITFERTGTSLVVKQSGSAITTAPFTGVSEDLYLHVYFSVTGFSNGGISECVVTGTTASEPSASSAPTITATAGHTRNHIAITMPSGANGVSIYRSTSSGTQDFTLPIVTDWRHPYFEDTGLTNGTTYYYKANATINGLSESTASSETSSAPVLNNIPSITDSIGFILGSPQVKPIGNATTDAEILFDYLQEDQTMRWGLICPKVEQHVSVTGTVSLTNGGRTVTGSSTLFTSIYRPDSIILLAQGDGSTRYYYVRYIDSDTSLTLWDAYTGTTGSGRSHHPHTDEDTVADRIEAYVCYYDLALSLYGCYYRTGSQYHLQLARECADTWRNYLENGKSGATYSPNPRASNLAGLAICALESGDTTFWTTIKGYADQKAFWVSTPVADHNFVYVRDEAYIIQWHAIIGKAYPDSSVRSSYTSTVLTWYLGYFEAEQAKYTDHQVRMDDFDFTPDNYYHYHQPFIDAIYGEAAVMVHKLTGNATVKAGYLAWVAATFADLNNKMTVAGYRLNYAVYAAYHSSEPQSNGVNIPPSGFSPPYDPVWQSVIGKNDVEPVREFTQDETNEGHPRLNNNITISNYGYAYYLTGDTAFTDQADTRINATYDGWEWGGAIRQLCTTGKNVNEAFRRSPSYFAYRDVITPDPPRVNRINHKLKFS
jgi:hypothetical protein